jgi:hypothetical protein
MMFRLPNFADTSFRDQSAPSSADFAIIASGFQYTGVVSGMVVSNQATGLTLDISAGVAFSKARRIRLVSPTTLALTPADVSSPRIDLVIARPNISVDATAVPSWTLMALPGLAVAPVATRDVDLADGDVVLAAIYVPQSAANLVAAHILDKRVIVPDSDSYFIEAWGAIGDNDSAKAAANSIAMKNAILAVPVSTGTAWYSSPGAGGKIRARDGHFYFNGLIALPKAVDFYGNGLTSTVFHCNDTNAQIQRGIWNQTGYRGGCVGGFSIDGHRVANNPFSVGKLSEHSFQDITVVNALQDNITLFGTNNANFINVNAEQASRRNLHLDYGAAGNCFLRCEFNMAAEYGVYFGSVWGYPRLLHDATLNVDYWGDTGTPCQNNQFVSCIVERGDEWSDTYSTLTYNTLAQSPGAIYHGAGTNNAFLFLNCGFGDKGMAKTSFIYVTQRVDRPTTTGTAGSSVDIEHPSMTSQHLRFIDCFFQGVTGTDANPSDGTTYHTLYNGRGSVAAYFEGYHVFSGMKFLWDYDDTTTVNVDKFNEQGAQTTIAINGAGGSWPANNVSMFHNIYNKVRETLIVQKKGGSAPSVSDAAILVMDATNSYPRWVVRSSGQMLWGSGTSFPTGTTALQINRAAFDTTVDPGTGTNRIASNTIVQDGQPMWLKKGLSIGGGTASALGADYPIQRYIYGTHRFGSDQVLTAGTDYTATVVITTNAAGDAHVGDPVIWGYHADDASNRPDKLIVDAQVTSVSATTATVTIRVHNVSGSITNTLKAGVFRVGVMVHNETGLTI